MNQELQIGTNGSLKLLGRKDGRGIMPGAPQRPTLWVTLLLSFQLCFNSERYQQEIEEEKETEFKIFSPQCVLCQITVHWLCLLLRPQLLQEAFSFQLSLFGPGVEIASCSCWLSGTPTNPIGFPKYCPHLVMIFLLRFPQLHGLGGPPVFSKVDKYQQRVQNFKHRN